MVKAALAAFFMKILPRNCWQRLTLIVSFWVFAAFTLVYAFVTLFQCGSPTESLSDPNAWCMDVKDLTDVAYASAAFNMGMDWLMTLMPVTAIWNANMSRKLKTSVIFVMSLGALGSIISLVRIPFIGLALFDGSLEGFRKVTPFLFLALWENCMGIMAVSLAALRPLFKKALGDGSTMASTRGRATPLKSLTHLSQQWKRSRGLDSITSSSQEHLGGERDVIKVATTVRVEQEDRYPRSWT